VFLVRTVRGICIASVRLLTRRPSASTTFVCLLPAPRSLAHAQQATDTLPVAQKLASAPVIHRTETLIALTVQSGGSRSTSLPTRSSPLQSHPPSRIHRAARTSLGPRHRHHRRDVRMRSEPIARCTIGRNGDSYASCSVHISGASSAIFLYFLLLCGVMVEPVHACRLHTHNHTQSRKMEQSSAGAIRTLIKNRNYRNTLTTHSAFRRLSTLLNVCHSNTHPSFRVRRRTASGFRAMREPNSSLLNEPAAFKRTPQVVLRTDAENGTAGDSVKIEEKRGPAAHIDGRQSGDTHSARELQIYRCD
jgi:hypothetical protein